MSGGEPATSKIWLASPRSSGADLIYRTVLNNVASGVLSIDSRGVVTSFNVAASEIVGLPGETVVGRTFAEVLHDLEGGDEFCDVILDAVYDSSVGHQRVVQAAFGGRAQSLSVATSYLKEERDGETVRVGVVAVFNDISEIKTLREQELRLAREVEANHTELRDAYRTLESSNRELSTALRKMRVLRIGAAVFVLAVFLALGLYTWSGDQRSGILASVTGASAGVEGDPVTLVVEPQRVSSAIAVTGYLAPRREIVVTSPIDGKVAAVHFRYGERVEKGQRLVDLNVGDVQFQYGEARATHIKARERVKELDDWSNRVDVSRARRTVSKSRMALETRQNRLAETEFLLERGVIPASEHEAAEREHRNQQLDLQSVEQDLEIVLAKGVTDGRVARLELENARARMENLAETLRNAAVDAPVAGVVMLPKRGDDGAQAGEKERRLVRGGDVKRGGRLLTIGDLDGLTVVGRVDEVDVVRVRPGQPARIAGDAFPGIELHGTIAHVSSEAISGGSGNSLPFFEVAAVVQDVPEARRGLLRVGMSANLEVVVYEKADAILVPIGAVRIGDGQPRIRVKDPDSGTIRSVVVVTGVTTVDSVEIVDGIAAGDEIVIAGR